MMVLVIVVGDRDGDVVVVTMIILRASCSPETAKDVSLLCL